jgi:site-specific DNA recombinase
MVKEEKVACYVRVSSNKQAKDDRYSIPEQINILENICKRNNWDYDIYKDLGISGETIKERPQLKELLKGCSNGVYSRVLVVDQDRLSRNVKDLQVLKEVLKYNNIKLMLQNTVLDLNNKDDDFMSDIQGIFSKRELKVIAERSARGRYQKAKQGKFPSGGNSLPYGYKLDDEDRLVIDEEEARVVRRIFDLIANHGWSCYRVPDDLNALGIPTRLKKLGRVLRSKKYNRIYENKWTRNNVKSIVSNELYYKDEYIYAQSSKFDFVKPVSIKKEPIISKRIFLKAKKQLAANKSDYNNRVKTMYILTGRLFCYKCKYPFCGGRYSTKKGAIFYYSDLGKKKEVTDKPCSSAAVRKELIENIIKDDIKNFILNPDNIKKYVLNKNKKKLNNDFKAIEFENKKDKINRDIDKLLELYLNEDIPESIRKESIADKLKEKEKELKIIDKMVFELRNKEELERLKEKRINSLKSLLNSLKLGISRLSDVDWKRIISKFIDRIEIDSEGKMTETTKLDVYIHYNFGSLVAENMGEITPRWANGGIGRRARFRT